MLIRIEAHYGCWGLIAEDGIIVKAAPIAKWAIGKPVDKVIAYYKSKSCKIASMA